MGGCNRRAIKFNDFSYGIKVGEPENQNQSAIFRHEYSVQTNTLYERQDENLRNMREIFLNSVRKVGKKSCLGYKDPISQKYQYLSYNEVHDLANYLGSAIIQLNLQAHVKEFNDMDLNIVGIFSQNCLEWYLIDIACTLFGFQTCPFYDNLGTQAIPFILAQTNMTSIFIQNASLDNLLKCQSTYQLKNLILIDKISEENRKKVIQKGNNFQKNQIYKGYQLYEFNDILQIGKENLIDYNNYKINEQDLFTFAYTSGTTGNPKGAMISHQNMTSLMMIFDYSDININEKDSYLSYLPLPHIYERVISWGVLSKGSTISISCNLRDLNKLFNDLQEVKPTVFISVPRHFNKIHDKIKTELESQKMFKKLLLERAIKTKLENLSNFAIYKHSAYDNLVFKKTKELLGGRIRLMVTASAPISSEVLNFLKIAICCPIIEAYGLTESTGPVFTTFSRDPLAGHVGGPQINIEYMVEGVPDMSYHVTDKNINGEVVPRGEICLRGPAIFLGYYKDVAKTKEAIDQKGWLHTGDIGEIRPNGSLKIFDRKKNIFKLAQGEYVAPEKLEQIYKRAKGVVDIFVYGESIQYYLIAIVHPDQSYIENYAKENKIVYDKWEDLLSNQEIASHILSNIKDEGVKSELLGMEIIRQILLIPQPFQVLDVLTNTFKLRRHDAKMFFGQQIKELYTKVI